MVGALWSSLSARGQIPDPAKLQGLRGPALRAALHQQMTNHSVVPFGGDTRPNAQTAWRDIDMNPASGFLGILLVYGSPSVPVSAYQLPGGWKLEHLWPSAYGLGEQLPAYSELNNLRPCDIDVSETRGNKWFDVSDPKDAGYLNPAHPEAPGCTSDSDSWEPPAGGRGDIARSLFYMDVRYEGGDGGPDLRLVEDVSQIHSGTNLMGRLSTLLRWDQEDPPDNLEVRRHSMIGTYQRYVTNPFVRDRTLAARLYIPELKLAQRGGGAFEMVHEPSDLPLVMEFAPTPAGPWTAGSQQPTGSAYFARLRLAD